MMITYALSTKTSIIKREIKTIGWERKGISMTIKRGIKAVVCCMALMGMLTMDVLPVQAAICSHKFRYIIMDDFEGYHYEWDGHFEAYGTAYVCADCGDKYWEDLQYVKFEDHEWELYEVIGTSDGTLMFRYKCTNPNCGMILGD